MFSSLDRPLCIPISGVRQLQLLRYLVRYFQFKKFSHKYLIMILNYVFPND